jgi:hypothetical protein
MSRTASHLVDHALTLPPGRSLGTNSPPDCCVRPHSRMCRCAIGFCSCRSPCDCC